MQLTSRSFTAPDAALCHTPARFLPTVYPLSGARH
jgi:hypothetical protein